MTSIENELAGFLRIKDRLESTTNEKLESVLSLLLPRIIPIVNDPEKRDAIMEIIKVAKERIESVNVPLPTLRLLELVSTEFQPKAGILAIEFLDICISNISPDIHMECIKIIIHNLAELKPFSEESNALLYYFSRFLPSLTTNSECINILKRAPLPVLIMIGDWLFDATQLQVVTVRDAVGSVVQGLSPERMHRLTVRHQTWTLADIRSLKHDLIKSFSMPWLPSALTMCILLSCLHSNDQEVKSEAIFKVNGARGLFDIHEDVNAAQTISTLLNLCIHRSHLSIIVDNVCVSEDGPDALISTICNNRSDLPNTFKIVILEFLVKEMTGHIRRHANIIFKLVKSSILYVSENTNSINPTITEEQSINNPTAFAFRSLTMKLLNKLTVKLSIEELTTHQKLLIATIKSCLQQFVVKGTRIVGEELSRSAMLRDSCYEIVSHVTVATAVNPSNSDYSLVETLFKMLDLEGTHTSVTLHSALGALRESLVTLQSSETVSYLSPQLRSLLLDTRKSSQRKVQVLTAQWMLSLFSWDQITIETLFLLATQVPSTREVGSSVAEDESVQTLIKREFTTLALSLRKESSTLTTPTTKEIIFSNILRFIGSEQFNHFSFSKGHFYLLHSACIYMIDYMNSIYGSKFNYARASTYDILDQWIMKNRGAGIIIPSMIQVSEQIICASLESLAQLVVKVNDISVSERSRMIITTVQYIRNILMIYQSENIQSIVRTKLSSILQAWITDDNSNKYELNSTRYLLLQQDISLCLAIASSSANYTFISLQIRALSLAIPKSLFESNKPINISSLSGSWCGSFLSLCYMYRVIVDRVNNDSSLLSSTQLLSGNLVVSMHNIVTGSDLSGLTVETSLALSTLLLGYRQILSTSTSKVLSTEHLQLHKETINMLSTSLNKVTRPVAATAIFDFLATEIDPENNTDTDTVQSQLSLYVLSSKWWASRNTFWTTEVSTSELFAFAELAFRYLHTSSSFMLDIETKLKSISYAQEKVSAREKTSASIFLLVLIRTQLQSCLSLADILALQSKLFEWIDRLLHNLLFKDLLVQDICVLSLGYIYQHITSLSTNSATVIEDAKVLQDIANRIAHEVIVILCKDKRLNQPVGMAVAGENTEATVAPVDAMTDILAGDADDTGFLNNDPLVRAASALVSELGVQLVQRTENIGTGATGNAPQNRAAATNISSTQNYGIFTSIAKLAKKVRVFIYK